MNPNDKNTILVTCAPGLSEFLCQEVETLGYSIDAVLPAGAELQGDLYDVMRLNLHLRTAYNVLFLLKKFECHSPEALYREVKDFPWEEMISPQELLSVVGRIDTASIDNSMYANLKAKDAIVDRIFEKTGSRPDSSKDKTGVVVQFYWKGEHCRLFLNTSGLKLTDRGYRKMPLSSRIYWKTWSLADWIRTANGCLSSMAARRCGRPSTRSSGEPIRCSDAVNTS